jgi:hypothetical protein
MPDPAMLKRDLARLDARRLELDSELRDAVARQLYAGDAEGTERARADEARLLAELDRLMTRIRATEAKLLLAIDGTGPGWA